MKTMLITGAASGIGKATLDMALEKWPETIKVCGIDIEYGYDVSLWNKLPFADIVVACAGVRAAPLA
jgi:hypothetical protein